MLRQFIEFGALIVLDKPNLIHQSVIQHRSLMLLLKHQIFLREYALFHNVLIPRAAD